MGIVTVRCGRCGGYYPPDPLHAEFAHPAPHFCAVVPPSAAPTHDKFEVRPYEFIVAAGEVYDELSRSCAKHPMYPRDPLRRTGIVGEEFGEALQAAMDLTRTATEGFEHHDLVNARERLREEMRHTASSAIAMLIAMKREDKESK